MKYVPSFATAWLALAASAQAAALLAPGDFIVAVNTNTSDPNSGYPAGENPPKAIDGVAPTGGNKYLNFGGFGTGFIATPTSPAAMQSFTIATGGDAVGRDPARYQVWGTNDAITSADNSTGTAENWTLVSSGSLALPGDRNTISAPVSFANTTSYSSYKIVFPTLKSDTLMQIGEFTGYTDIAGAGSSIFTDGDPTLAIDTPVSASRHPMAEGPVQLIDGDTATKYLNFGGPGSGFIVTPSGGPSVVGSMILTTGNDTAGFPDRNPTSYEIYGTSQSITSYDNSYGTDEAWTLISAGSLSMPAENFAEGEPATFFDNETEYTSYKVLFPTLDGGDRIQLSEAQLYAVPEPGVAVLCGVALLGLGLRRRR